MARWMRNVFGILLAGVFLFPCLFSRPALAEELPVFYKGVRPLGMGGAFTAVADDENAMFYNPAGLNKIEGFGGIGILNPYAEISKNTLDFIKDVTDLSDADTDAEQTALASDLMDRWMGEHLRLRAGLFPNVTVHNFGVGFLGQAAFDFEVHNPLGSRTLDVRGAIDMALLVSGAYAFTVKDNPLRVGLTAKMINRRLLDQQYSTFDLVQKDGIDLDDDLKSGNGIGVDLGAIYSFPVFLEPSVGIAIQNIADTKLGDAGKIEQQVNLGAAIYPPIGFGKLVLALDVMDFTHQLGSDNDLGKRLHLGVEYRLPIIIGIRAGLHQGYPSYGFTVDFWVLKLDYAYYTEEIGAFAGQRKDRRHVAQLQLLGF